MTYVLKTEPSEGKFLGTHLREWRVGSGGREGEREKEREREEERWEREMKPELYIFLLNRY